MVEAPEVLTVDAFAQGFAADAPGDPWFHVRAGTYVAADGTATPLAGGGLHVAPPRVNPRTGRPAFSISLASESRNGGIPATNDHAKWLAYLNVLSSGGFPGFDAMPGTELSGTVRMGGRTFGTELHPFGAAVRDPHADPRLAAFAMATIDLESWMVFDVLFTNRRVYAVYERLPFGRNDSISYAAFSYAIPVGERADSDQHEATIAYDAAAGHVRWMLDGVEVYRVTRIGHHLNSRDHLLIDLGGTEQTVLPRQLAFGMGLFTLLDGAVGTGPGLVRLSEALSYNSPRRSDAQPLPFVDDHSRPESRLFGQGAEMAIASYTLRRRPCVSREPPSPGAVSRRGITPDARILMTGGDR